MKKSNKKLLIGIAAVIILLLCCAVTILIGISVSIFTVAPSVNIINNEISEYRDAERLSDLTNIKQAIEMYNYENRFPNDLIDEIPSCAKGEKYIGDGGVDLESYLVPTYLVGIPQDPQERTSFDTGYTICKTSSTNVKLSAPYTEGDIIIEIED